MKPLNRYIQNKFLVFSILTIGVAIILLNISFQIVFRNYIADSGKEEVNKVLEQIENTIEDQEITQGEFQLLNRFINSYKMHVTISIDENILFDNERFQQGRKMAPMHNTYYEYFYETYTMNFYDDVYEVTVGIPSGIVSEIDDRFLLTINLVFIFVFLIATITTVLISKIMTKKIATPILNIKNQTAKIYEKNYQQAKSIESDILELSQLSKEVEHLATEIEVQETYQQQMTIDIAHELRSPLAVLRSHIEAFIDEIWKPSPERLGHCHDEIIRLTTLIDDLNDLADIEKRGFKVELKDVKIEEIIDSICLNFESIYNEKGLYVRRELEKDLIIKGDVNRLKQIFVNLLMNSYKYTDNGGIEIKSYRTHEDSIVVKLTDTGVGITEDQQNYIFKRFYRTDSSRSRKTGGAGIGLSIVKGLVEAHNGTIEVESELEKGTTFILTFKAL